MSLDWNKINECRRGYIDKRNKKNEEIALENGLTENQIEAIEDICRLRHEIHSLDVAGIRSGMSADSNLIEDNLDKIHNLIDENKLPKLGVYSDTYVEDWELEAVWDDDEEYRDTFYEEAQKEVNEGFEFDTEDKRIHTFPIYSIDELAYRCFCEYADHQNSEIKEKINTKIEQWLQAIDNKYGTNYCPIGGQRF